jgi:hypothetical protein
MKKDAKAVRFVPVCVLKKSSKWPTGLIQRDINPLKLQTKVSVLVVPFVPGCVLMLQLKYLSNISNTVDSVGESFLNKKRSFLLNPGSWLPILKY